MLELAERIWAWLHTHEGRKIFRYTMVSAVSTVVSVVVLAITYGALRAFGGSEVWCTVFSNFVATFPSYWLNRNWAWGKSGRSHLLKEVVPFWVMACMGIAFSIVGASLAAHVGKVYDLSHLERTVVVVAANLLSFAIFWVLKLMLFNRLFRVDLLDEIDEELSAEESAEGAAVR